MSGKTRYAAYLVRWQEQADQSQWRAVAEDVYSGEKTHFTSKNALLHFLWQSLNSPFALAETAAEMRKEE
jgi:hypothetical protein